MATPEPSDPSAPTHKIEPATHSSRPEQSDGRTRWVTQILRPRNGSRSPERLDDAARTAVLPARTRRLGSPGAPSGGGPAPESPWRSLLSPLLGWFPRLISRVVVGPAGELDYAIPAELRHSYRVHGHIGSGGEAVVYLAEPADAPGRQLALKVYRPGHDINRELLDRLRARGAADPYTPAIHGYGLARSSWGEDVAWEAQEYFAEGSLRSVIDQAPLPDDRARDIVAAVAACLHHWQDSLQHNHTDVKPENLLIRKLDPPVFALTDFGGAVRATMSRVYGGQAITEDYAAPEVIEGRREAPAAWWSLGVMVHELRSGRRPARGENWLTARNTDIDVSAIPEEEWRLLAQGLLTPVPSARWGYAEVRQWLAGERPQIVKARRYAPISFADVSHDDPPSLAFDLMDRSDKGAVWLRTHWSTLRTWLDREVNDYTFDRAYLLGLDEHPERAHVAISALAARFVPGMAPRYRGHEISAEGVLAMATGESSRHAALREAIELGALGLAARHWCDHPTCRAEGTNRCALLERVQHEVPLIMKQVESTVERLVATSAREAAGSGTAPAAPAAHEWDTAWAQATELVLDPEAGPRHRRFLRAQSWHPAQRSNAPRTGWWSEQRCAGLRGRIGDVATNAALITAVLLLPGASQAGAMQRQQEREDSRLRWRSRWHGIAAAAGAARSRAHDRSAPQSQDSPGGQPPTDEPQPYGERYRDRSDRQQQKEQRRIDRGMRQIQRAMGAGRCRRFAYPAGLLGVVEGLGRSLLPSEGFFPENDAVLVCYEGLLAFSNSAAVSAVSSAAGGLFPGDVGHSWWFPVVLGLVLFFLGHTAAGRHRRARTQLMSYRLALAGSLLMAFTLLAGGLLALGAGVLIPLDSLLG